MKGLALIKAVFAVLAVGFLLAPLAAILPLSFTDSVFLTYPIESFSMRWFDALFTDPNWRMSIVNSLIIGGGTTALATVLGTVGALGLRGRKLAAPLAAIQTVFLLPMVVPAVVMGVGMQMVFAQVGLNNTYIGVIFAHTVIAVPFVVVNVSSVLQGLNPRLEQAASSLGAAPVTVFFQVTLPLASPGIVTGAVFAFATSLDEVVLTLFVAGPNQRTLARQMFSTIRENISPAIAAAAAVFIVSTIVLGLAISLLRRRQQQA